MLAEKYAPENIKDILNNKEAIARLENFANAYINGELRKPLLIYGPTGVGKTTAVYALAKTFNFDLIELNASDYRDAQRLNKKVMPAMSSMNIFKKIVLFLFDEIDELAGRLDSGAENAIIRIITKARQPIIFTADDFWNQKISFLRNYVDKVEFKRPSDNEIKTLLINILRKEKKFVKNEILDIIVKRSNGDIRAALNDLEAIIDENEELLDYIGIRDKKLEIFPFLDKIFLNHNFDIPYYAMSSIDLDLDMIIKWIDENIPNVYRNGALARAYESLSEGSRFFEKANRTGYYLYLRYASVLVSSGVSLADNIQTYKFKPYSFPKIIKEKTSRKDENERINEIIKKLKSKIHESNKVIKNEYIPLIALMLKLDKENIEEKARSLYGIEDEDIKYLVNWRIP